MSDFFSKSSSGGLGGSLPNGVKMAAAALLIQQLLKHAQSSSPQGPEGQVDSSSASAGGGLGGLLGGLLGGGASSPQAGGAVTGGLGGLLGGLLGGGSSTGGGLGGLLGSGASGGLGGLLGGLGGLLGTMRNQGLGQKVDSWVSTGPNQTVSPQELEGSFAPQDLDEAARHAGTDRSSVLTELSSMLPNLVDRVTPQGGVPKHEGELAAGGLSGLFSSLIGHSSLRS